jgi:hypothetical protein
MPSRAPRRPRDRLRRLVDRAVAAAPTDRVSTDRRAWAAFVAYAAAVTALHVWGLSARLYWSIPWYDLLTHSLSGAGVAAFGSLLGVFRGPTRRRVALAAATLVVVGAGFEVYERLFRTFWQSWTVATYVEDTVVDVVVDAVGGAAFVALASRVRRTTGEVGATAGRGTASRRDGSRDEAGSPGD